MNQIGDNSAVHLIWVEYWFSSKMMLLLEYWSIGVEDDIQDVGDTRVIMIHLMSDNMMILLRIRDILLDGQMVE